MSCNGKCVEVSKEYVDVIIAELVEKITALEAELLFIREKLVEME